ncbi:hypothetical protein [Bacillus paranthracis]|uniref:hypothetical protein n=1 Tax=Bacillus paranthracis TaxID=2026186 RepID=UPI0022E513D3|nr:hypothetical protein [Bacillus paranthracis]
MKIYAVTPDVNVALGKMMKKNKKKGIQPQDIDKLMAGYILEGKVKTIPYTNQGITILESYREQGFQAVYVPETPEEVGAVKKHPGLRF